MQRRMAAIDCESTGIDVHHIARPFMFTTCDTEGLQKLWTWDVDPIDRKPQIPLDEVEQVQAFIDSFDILVLQNSKFDAAMLTAIGIDFPWHKVRDTLTAGHLLASNHKHDLTSMCVEHIGKDILHFETAVKVATKAARDFVRKEFPDWRLAKEGDPDMPSVSGQSKRDEDKPWKNDMWLPRLLWQLGLAEHPSWENVTAEYANADSRYTLLLWIWMEEEIKRKKLWAIYINQLNLPRIGCKIERNGVTASGESTNRLIKEYSEQVEVAKGACVLVANKLGYDIEMPNGASPNDSLREFFWGSTRLTCPRCGLIKRAKEWADPSPVEGTLCPKCEKKQSFQQMKISRNPCLNLEKIYDDGAKSSSPTLNKNAMAHYQATLPPGDALDFVTSLAGMRSRQTAVGYATSYSTYWLPVPGMGRFRNDEFEQLWFRLHPSLNPTGTDTLRWSSSNPNSQNISKKESFNLRRCFGPMPGREWWSMDGKNLELRIPAFEAEEKDLMWVFEHPDEAPYFGSYHLVVFDLLHPELFREHGKKVKDLFESTWYQWVKNGNFAIIYGCQRKKADQTYHVPGAYDLLQHRFPNIAKLSEKQKRLADKFGYVETIPDKTVCPERGYPILCSRGDDGRVLPTTPLNYHVSGTAMQWTNKAMIRCDAQIEEWNKDGWDGFITLQVHDELVFDVPKGTHKEQWRTNLPRMRKLKMLMEMGGEDISVPTPVSVECHTETWATGISI